MSRNIKDFYIDELKEEFKKLGEKPFRAEQVYEWIYKKKVNSFDEMFNDFLEIIIYDDVVWRKA